MLTPADYIRPLRPHIPLSVASDEAFERILALTSRFPAKLANQIFCFEVYLGKNLSFIDYSVHFRTSTESQLSLLPVSASDHPWKADHLIWQKIYRFFSLWCEPTSLLHRYTDHVWLSFDLDQAVPDMPIPSIFYCSVSTKDRKANPLPTIHFLADIFREPIEVTHLANNLACCLQHIPERAHVNQVGFGLLRNSDTIRLQVIGLSPHEIPTYLAAVGWAYPTEHLQPLLNQLYLYDLLTLTIDVSASIHPKIGIECYLDKPNARWQMLLGNLVEQGLCQPAERDFLGTCQGVKLYQLDLQVSLTLQRLSHIKMVYHPERTSAPLEAKAYLFYYPGWLSATTNGTGG